MSSRTNRRSAATAIALALLLGLETGCDHALSVPVATAGAVDDAGQEQRLAYFIGAVNRPSAAQVADWTQFVQTFWGAHFSPPRVASALAVQSVDFVDRERIAVQGRDVRAYSTGRHAVVGMRTLADGAVDWAYVESLFKHELGHGVLGELGVVWDEQVHHQLFADLGYGH